MISKLILRNFKMIVEEEFRFSNFDLLVGKNNSGKSTILQALAIWQFCIDEFRRSKRRGKKGLQVVLPNFSAVPVPEFRHLWKDRTERRRLPGKKQEYILIDIEPHWMTQNQEEKSFGILLRYQTPQSVYAIPAPDKGWQAFREFEEAGLFPRVAYVPPFSGLEPSEEWHDISVIKKQVGKAQPGSILRNLLWLVTNSADHKARWEEIADLIEKLFSVKLKAPKYDTGVDIFINCEYEQRNKSYDLIAGGSGFHQVLTLLAFLYGYRPDTILLDEPDAHLHVNLQREVLDYFKTKSIENKTQFLIATHAEELVKGVNSSQIISVIDGKGERNRDVASVLKSMAVVSNQEETQLRTSPFILYVEGDSDERILRAWAQVLKESDLLGKYCFHYMGGGDKKMMVSSANSHFKAAQVINKEIKRLMVFDYDESSSWHPGKANPVSFEWQRRSIENYLLVPDAWYRTVIQALNIQDGLFATPVRKVVDEFFGRENLTLPRGQCWATLDANIFKQVDGKKLLFTDEKALASELMRKYENIKITPELIAQYMEQKEIHNDVRVLFGRIEKMVNGGEAGG